MTYVTPFVSYNFNCLSLKKWFYKLVVSVTGEMELDYDVVEEREEKKFDQYDLIEKVMKDADREEKESLKVCTAKPTHVVTSIKQAPVLKGHIFLVMSENYLY